MKYIKKFEKSDFDLSTREELLTSVCFYFENIIPITEEEGFVECLWDDSDGLNKEYFTFHFSIWTDEDIYEKFENFLKRSKLKIKNERITKVDVQINVKIPEYKIKKYANLYGIIKKYNL